MADSPVVGSASFELRADKSKLPRDVAEGARVVQQAVASAEKGAVIPLRADTSAIIQAGRTVQAQIALNRSQLLELTHVGRAVFDEIVAGGSPLRALALESGRIAQIAEEGQGGFSGLAKSIVATVGPAGGAIAAFAGVAAVLGGLFVLEQRTEQANTKLANSLLGVGAASGETVADLNKLAEANAAAGDGSVAFGKSAEAAFLRVGVTKDNLSAALALVQNFAAVTGTDAPHAVDALAKALEHPDEAAKTLGATIGNLSAEQIHHIELLESQGQHTQAVTALINGLAGGVEGARPHLTALGESFAGLSSQIQGAIDKLGQFLTSLFHTDAAGKIVELQARRAQLVADRGAGQRQVDLPDGTSTFVGLPSGANDAAIAAIDKQLASLKVETAAPAKNAKAAQDAKTSREQDSLVSTLDPDLAELRSLRAGVKGATEALHHLVPGGPSADDLVASIKRARERIDQIETRGQKKPRRVRTPADTTEAHDDTAENASLAADKDLATALKERAAEERKTNVAAGIEAQYRLALVNADRDTQARQAEIIADSASKSAKLDQDEAHVRAQKNDAHKAEQIALIEAARTKLDQATQTRLITSAEQGAADKEKAARDRVAGEVAAEEAFNNRQDAYYSAIDAIRASYANTSQERLAVDLQHLADEKVAADHARESARQTKVNLVPSGPGHDAEVDRINAAAAVDQGQQNDLNRRRQAQLSYQDASPLDKFRQEGPQDAKAVSDAFQTAAVQGLGQFNDGLAEALVNGKSLGDVLHSVFAGLEADLVRYLLKQAEIGILGGPIGAPGAAPAGAGLFAGIGKLLGFAGGGQIGGPGSGTSDSILARVSAGEFVVSAAAAKANLPLLHAINEGRLPAFADGGLVGRIPLPANDAGSRFASTSAGAPAGAGRPGAYFDLRGSLTTADFIADVNGKIANGTAQAVGISVAHTNTSLSQSQRSSARAQRNSLSGY